MRIERWVYMRYAGQGWEIPVELRSSRVDEASGELLAVEFTKAYEEFFGRAIEGLAIEAVGWSVRASIAQPRGRAVERSEGMDEAEATGVRTMLDTATMSDTEARVVSRPALVPGSRVTGPAVIVEPQTTTVLPSTHEAVAQSDGCLLVRARRGARGWRP